MKHFGWWPFGIIDKMSGLTCFTEPLECQAWDKIFRGTMILE